MVSIGRNINALRVLRQLSTSSSELSRSFERLSSGQRINRASDDAASLAVASSLALNGRVFTQGVRNINDGLSLLNIAQGGLSELGTITTRLKELAQQAANGTLSLAQRGSLDQEADALTQEFNRLTSVTSFNGVSILLADLSSVRIQSGYGADGGTSFNLTDQLRHGINTGALASATTLSFGTGNKSRPISVDFNNDGFMDVATIGSGAGLRVSLGNGDGTFQAVQSYAMATAVNMATGDMNGDGLEDIFVQSNSGANQIFLNAGNGTFTQTASFTDTSGSDLQLADINNDGRDDLVYTTGTSALSYRLANSDGSLQSAQTTSSSFAMQNLRLADFDGDGILDAVATEKSGSNLAFFRGNGNGSFSSQSVIAGGFGSLSSIEVGDLNDDGLIDIVVNGASGVGVLTASSAWSFTAGSTFDSNASGVRLADLDGDGHLDVVTNDGASVSVYRNSGSGSFSSYFSFGDYEAGGALADFNGDGALDLVAARAGDTNLYFIAAVLDYTTSIGELNLHRREGALDAIARIQEIQDRIALQLGKIGANQSRLAAALGALTAKADEYKAAESRILDVDVASESAQSVRLSILQNAGAAVLAQANQSPALALTLLKASE